MKRPGVEKTKAGQAPTATAVAGPYRAVDDLSRADWRLLEALAEEGASASDVAEAPDVAFTIAVFAPRNGVSLRVMGAPRESAERLVAQDLARWSVGARSHRRRLVIAAPGRAALARRADPHAAPFLAQHTELAPLAAQGAPEQEGARSPTPSARAPLIDRGESPLAWLVRRKDRDGAPLIDPACFEAGERLRRDLTFAMALPRVTADWGAAGGGGAQAGGPAYFTDAMLAARQRVDRALRAVGPEFSGLLMDVCGSLKGLETIEQERGWPRRSARIVLGLALSKLASHYGLSSQARGPAHARLVQWGEADYRPRIDGAQADDGVAPRQASPTR